MDFPRDVAIDPLDYKIASLGFKEVIQYKTWDKIKTPEYKGRQVLFEFQFSFSYNEDGRLDTYKYDFREPFPNSPFRTTNIKKGDSSQFYQLKLEDTSRYYIYHHHQFNYTNGELSSIDLKKAYRDYGPIAGVLDGVYIKDIVTTNVLIQTTYDTDFRMIKKTITKDNGEVERYKYYYETFEDKYEVQYSLLSKVELEFRGNKSYTHIEYRK